jgi:hypothetical protein
MVKAMEQATPGVSKGIRRLVPTDMTLFDLLQVMRRSVVTSRNRTRTKGDLLASKPRKINGKAVKSVDRTPAVPFPRRQTFASLA